MDKVAIIFRALEIIPKFFPKPKPPVIDYGPLYEALPGRQFQKLSATEIQLKTEPRPAPEADQYKFEEPIEIKPVSEVPQAEEVSTACISCSRSHLSTVSGALGESLRFARDEGINHPEVQRRLMLSEDEINIMERIDLAPDALSKAAPEERQLAEEYLPRIRKLRQDLGQIKSVERLEGVASEASLLGQEFRLRHLQLQGVDLNPVMELARKVQRGEISMAAAKEQLKVILPEEEYE